MAIEAEQVLIRHGFVQDNSRRAWVLMDNCGNTIMAISDRVLCHMDFDVASFLKNCPIETSNPRQTGQEHATKSFPQ